MWDFIPDEEYTNKGIEVPFFEEARANFAPYYSVDKKESDARTEVIRELSKLGAYDIAFQSGHFDVSGQVRYGYAIHFKHNGAAGLLRVAGLPMQNETASKVAKVRVQALMNVRDWLKTAITQRVFSPGSDALTPLMLVDASRGITVGDLMTNYLETGRLPQLSAGEEDIVEGDFKVTP